MDGLLLDFAPRFKGVTTASLKGYDFGHGWANRVQPLMQPPGEFVLAMDVWARDVESVKVSI